MAGVGALRWLVALDEPTVQPDGSGGQEAGWSERMTVWAAFRWLRGGETVQAARLEGRQPAVITLSATKQTRLITPAWRLRDLRKYAAPEPGDSVRGVYNIRAVVETEDRRWIEITAETGVAT